MSSIIQGMLNRIADYLDDLLRNEEWSDIDQSVNGIQVMNSGDVSKAAFAVDASNLTIEKAAEVDTDLLVTHHGVIWGEIEQVTGQHYGRLKRLLKNDLALYTSHLPLDAHEDIGNNVLLMKELDISPEETFGDVGGQDIGYIGRLPETVNVDELIYEVENLVDNDSTVLRFGPEEIQDVAVLTGSGGRYIPDAAAAGADVLVSGEPKHRSHHDAREYGINAVFAGHYHTETFGVRALRREIENEFDIDTVFIKAPTKV